MWVFIFTFGVAYLQQTRCACSSTLYVHACQYAKDELWFHCDFKMFCIRNEWQKLYQSSNNDNTRERQIEPSLVLSTRTRKYKNTTVLIHIQLFKTLINLHFLLYNNTVIIIFNKIWLLMPKKCSSIYQPSLICVIELISLSLSFAVDFR